VSGVKKLGKAVAFPLWRKLRWRIEQVSEQRYGPRFEDLRRDLDGLRGELLALRDEVHGLRAELRENVRNITNRLDWQDNELKLRAPVLAGLQTRVAELERPGVKGEPVADEAAAEHARARARLSAVARYEERIARLEDALARQAGGAA